MAPTPSAKNVSGVGLAFNPALARFVGRHRAALDFLSVSPERFWHDRGPRSGARPQRYRDIPDTLRQLDQAMGDLPLVAHGIGLSIASTGPLDDVHVEQLAHWRQRFPFVWFSEHLAWFRLGPQHDWRGVGLLLPPVYDRAVLPELTGKLLQLHNGLGCDVLMENTVNYSPLPDQDMDEAEFLNALTAQSPCHLLLDLHNLHTNAVNHGVDPYAQIDRLDLDRVLELHIAGGEAFAGMWTDAHAGSCPPQVWNLLQHVLIRAPGIRAVTLEIDESWAMRISEAQLLAELDQARSIWQQTRARRAGATHDRAAHDANTHDTATRTAADHVA